MTLTTRTLIAAVTAFAILGLTAGRADATHSRGKCKAAGTTIAKNDTGRVYEREEEAEVKTLWGCTWSRNKPFEMEVATDDEIAISEDYSNVILRGRYVAWVFTREDLSCKADCPPNYDPTTEYVRTFDLRTRNEESEISNPAAGSLKLNTEGALAWLTGARDETFDVHAWDRQGHQTLDNGPIRGFRLRRQTLTWTNGDLKPVVTLRGPAR